MSKKEEKTNVMRVLEQKGIPFTPHTYPHEDGVAVDGVTVARSMGQDPECVFKTLVARGETIRQGDRILFWGSYDPAPKNVLFTLVSDGAPLAERARIPVEDAGQQEHAPRLIVLCQAALREELHQGDWGVFGIGALLTLLVMAWVLLSEAVFQFRASLWARGTGGAEPSQLYTTVEGLSWMVVTVLLALLYWMALTRIC